MAGGRYNAFLLIRGQIHDLHVKFSNKRVLKITLVDVRTLGDFSLGKHNSMRAIW
jgi:hypothetical protein